MRRELWAVTAACLLLTGCGAEAPAPSQTAEPEPPASASAARQERAFALPLDPAGSWNPYEGSRGSNQTLAPLLYESLFALDSSFAAQPLLAQSAAASEDGLSWTVTLREGISFSDGEPLTAKAAGEAVNAARGEKSVYAKRLAGIRKVSWDGDRTLTLTLAEPNARLTALLDFPIARVTREGVYGTGPYVLGEGKLTARQGWWRGFSLPLAEIGLVEVDGADALAALFNTGELSLVATDLTGADAPGFVGNFQNWEYPTTNMIYLGFQCAKGPCGDAGFRRAVSRAMDRELLVSQVMGGHASPAALPAPPRSEGYDAAAAQALSWDKEAAQAELDGLGYELDESGARRAGKKAVTLTLLVNAGNDTKEKLAQAVAARLEELGLGVEIKALAWEEYQKALSRGEFDLYLAECRLTGDMDPTPFFTQGSGLCYGGYENGEFSQALAQARKSGQWAEFYALWAREVPLAPLCFKNAQMLAQWGQLEEAEPTQGDLFFEFYNWKISE